MQPPLPSHPTQIERKGAKERERERERVTRIIIIRTRSRVNKFWSHWAHKSSLIAPRRRTRLMLLFHWWPVRSWPDRGQQSLSSLFHHHGELCSRLESGRSLAPYCGTWIACVKKERKRKKEKNSGKIQLARDPTASDDACPRPILGWPVYLPQPLAGARITEKRRRRPNHVTRFPSVRSACLLLFLVLYTTLLLLLLLLLCIRLHLLDMYKLAPLPNFSPSTPPKTASNMRRASIDGIFPALLLIFLSHLFPSIMDDDSIVFI